MVDNFVVMVVVTWFPGKILIEMRQHVSIKIDVVC